MSFTFELKTIDIFKFVNGQGYQTTIDDFITIFRLLGKLHLSFHSLSTFIPLERTIYSPKSITRYLAINYTIIGVAYCVYSFCSELFSTNSWLLLLL